MQATGDRSMATFVRIFCLLAVSMGVSADQIAVPNTFASGAKAIAADVNENFSLLVTESNAQDVRLVTVESNLNGQNEDIVALVADNNAQDQSIAVLAANSAAQDERITAIESAISPAVEDQLFCVAFSTWPVTGDSYDCTQLSEPTAIRSLTFAQVAAEGWIGVSVGGETGNRLVFIFSR